MNKENIENKSVLISGGSGFLGSYLCQKFLGLGAKVIAVDSLVTGSSENIKEFQNDERFSLIEHDICNPLNISEDIDYILHFASPASPVDYNKLPIFTLRTGSVGAYNMLELARKKKARILIASTSEVYGDPTIACQSENYFGNVNPIGKRSVYDEAKRYQEALTMAYHREYGLETRIVRIFNTYGPKMRLNDGRALPTFIGQALMNKKLTVFGDGSQTRSFCYVDDLIEGIFLLLFSSYTKPVNIGNPEEITILDFAKEIMQLSGKKLVFEYKDLPENDPLQRKPDIQLAQELLNWSPKISRAEGLKKTWEYFSNLTDINLNPREYSFK